MYIPVVQINDPEDTNRDLQADASSNLPVRPPRLQYRVQQSQQILREEF